MDDLTKRLAAEYDLSTLRKEAEIFLRLQDRESRFLRTRIKRQAHREVQGDHLRRVAITRNREAGELRELVETVRQRDATPVPPQAQPALMLLTDERNNPERRILRPHH